MESRSSFGPLRKQEADLQQLLRGSVKRTINLKNPVLQQGLERRNEGLCVLTLKAVTVQKCMTSENIQMEEKCGGMVRIQASTVQVSVTEDESIVKDASVMLEILAPCTMACHILELCVMLDSQFEFCLL